MKFSFKDCHPYQTPLTMGFGQNIVFSEKRGIYIFLSFSLFCVLPDFSLDTVNPTHYRMVASY
jgi:hypothetical protein